jgi:hypothetical protein
MDDEFYALGTVSGQCETGPLPNRTTDMAVQRAVIDGSSKD